MPSCHVGRPAPAGSGTTVGGPGSLDSVAMRIDFVSDVACPWCAVGLNSLELALGRLGDAIEVDIHFQPFELNPDLGPQGRDILEYMAERYGASPQQVAATRAVLRERGAAVGFSFGDRDRTWNTFDAHRLLHWAGLQGRQLALKRALLSAYHGLGRNPGAADVLLDCARQAGLDADGARAVIESDRYAQDVRDGQRHFRARGIHSVPSVIIDDRHLIVGGQPPETYEQALRQILAQT